MFIWPLFNIAGAVSVIMEARELFGGAATIRLPQCVDASELRPIPDHQEVFLLEGGSVIIEIVEMSGLKIEEHFREIGEINKSEKTEIFFVEEKNGFVFLRGMQVLGNKEVYFAFSLFSFERAEAEVLITIQSEGGPGPADFSREISESFQLMDMALFGR
eukprot:GHVN01007158.1.p1 GENE.GHVN01007158.1~~GHVN01007158.1.p1  ORF type:complete len:160 (+),score=9.65 GHVN01007158.1:89-568(+)